MSQIKQLQPRPDITLLAVKVSEGATEYDLSGLDLRLWYYQGNALSKIECFELPFECKLLGTLDQITEEIWQTLIEMQLVDARFGGLKYPNFNLKSKPHLSFDTATESAISFLEANEVYSVNPLGKKPPVHEDILAFASLNEFDCAVQKWQQAQSNTGTWIILMKQND